MSLLSKIINDPPRPGVILLLSSVAQSGVPILRQLLSSKPISDDTKSHRRLLLFCLSYSPDDLLELPVPSDFIEVHDCVSRIPEYDMHWSNSQDYVFSAIRDSE